jgi:hypothetical protein
MLVNEIIQSLLAENPPIERTADLLGREIERQGATGRRYEVGAIAGGQRFSEAFLGLREQDGQLAPKDVELTIRPESRYTVKELVDQFGNWKRVPPTIHQPNQIMFLKPGAGTHDVAVYCTLSSMPDDPAAVVERLLLVRQVKL